MIALVEHKANIKIRDNHADTPLHLAVQNGKFESKTRKLKKSSCNIFFIDLLFLVYLTLNKAKQAPNTPRRYVLARKGYFLGFGFVWLDKI